MIDDNYLAKWNIARAAAKNSLPCFLRQNWYRKDKKLEKHDAKLVLDGKSRLLEE